MTASADTEMPSQQPSPPWSPLSPRDRIMCRLRRRPANVHYKLKLKVSVKPCWAKSITSEDTTDDDGALSLFPTLPLELRRLIWSFALPGPRTIEVKSYREECDSDEDNSASEEDAEFETNEESKDSSDEQFNDQHEFSSTKIPAILLTSREARAAGLEHYSISLKQQLSGKSIYIDFAGDTLHFDKSDTLIAMCGVNRPSLYKYGHNNSKTLLPQEVSTAEAEICTLAIELPTFQDLIHVLPRFNDLETVLLRKRPENVRLPGLAVMNARNMAKMEVGLREQWEKAAEEKESAFNEPKLVYLSSTDFEERVNASSR